MVDTLPIAEVVHAMPGRTRLRILARRGDSVFFGAVATGLSTLPGVHHVDVRPLTGSLVIQHGTPLECIGAAAREARLFTIGNAPPPPTDPASIDARMLVGVGLGAFAVWQILEGKILPPAVTLAWYAASLTGLRSNGG